LDIKNSSKTSQVLDIDIYESGNFQGTRTLYKGLPQGSVLSSLLFNLHIKDIIYIVPYNCKIIQFADDITIFCHDKSIDKINDVLSKTFNKINN